MCYFKQKAKIEGNFEFLAFQVKPNAQTDKNRHCVFFCNMLDMCYER